MKKIRVKADCEECGKGVVEYVPAHLSKPGNLLTRMCYECRAYGRFEIVRRMDGDETLNRYL